ncbi:hypothetical protein IF1G_05746 [Cordyceps javanica]|uniref:Uncharacterized protein n=1 Tax=Cordyceps javanica TaxID=43265 RepID=A0A545V2I8_9HYPO|nr:hypothetical protein IF1G_05746 [Cordyceps javanica]
MLSSVVVSSSRTKRFQVDAIMVVWWTRKARKICALHVTCKLRAPSNLGFHLFFLHRHRTNSTCHSFEWTQASQATCATSAGSDQVESTLPVVPSYMAKADAECGRTISLHG